LVTSQLETADYVVTHIPIQHKNRVWTRGTQKSTIEQYRCKKCNFTEKFEEPQAYDSWKCKRCLI